MTNSTFGLDAAQAPSGAQGRKLLDAIGGHFWGVYIGGPRLNATARQTWKPSVVQDLAANGVAAFAPIYVGLQAKDMTAYTAETIEAAGIHASQDTAACMAAFGWAPGDLVFLDVEQYAAPSPDLLMGYALAWMGQMRSLGFKAGIYGSVDTLTRYFAAGSGHPLPDCLWIALYEYYGAQGAGTPLTRAMCSSVDPNAIPKLQANAFPDVPRIWQFAGNVTLFNSLVDANVSDAALVGPPQTAHAPSPQPAPQPASAAYRVQSGDTLSSIAHKQGISLAALEAVNPQIANPNLIAVGQVIHLPTA